MRQGLTIWRYMQDIPYQTTGRWTVTSVKMNGSPLKAEVVDLPLVNGTKIFMGFDSSPIHDNAELIFSLESSYGNAKNRRDEIEILHSALSYKEVTVEGLFPAEYPIGEVVKINRSTSATGYLTSFNVDYEDVNHCKVTVTMSIYPNVKELIDYEVWIPDSKDKLTDAKNLAWKNEDILDIRIPMIANAKILDAMTEPFVPFADMDDLTMQMHPEVMSWCTFYAYRWFDTPGKTVTKQGFEYLRETFADNKLISCDFKTRTGNFGSRFFELRSNSMWAMPLIYGFKVSAPSDMGFADLNAVFDIIKGKRAFWMRYEVDRII